jgi:hypothetical protein
MAPAQSALRSLDEHVHAFTETCPTCEQPIPNERAKEIRARAAALEKRLADAAEVRAAQRLAEQKAEIEGAAKAQIEQAQREKAEAVNKANVEATARIEAAKLEGQKSAEAAAAQKVAAAEKAKADAEKGKMDAEVAAAQTVTAAEQAAKAKQEEAQKQIDAANAKAQQAEADRDAAAEARAREVREAMEKDKAEALAKKDSENDEKTRKLLEQVHSLERKLEERRSDELGEGAHIKLLDALKEEFPGDDIRRIRPGVSGADILHTIMRNGQECGSILWESKNSTAWRDDYVTKLIRDQTAARADHAVLSTFKFPTGTAQVTHRDGVVIVNPARAVAIAHMIRKTLLTVHIHRLSKAERVEKMAALYDYMTSERCALHLNRIDSDAEALLDLQIVEKKFHDNHWGKQALRYRSIQKAKSDLDIEVGTIIGGVDPAG